MFTPDEILTAAMRKLMSEPTYSSAFQQLMAQCEADSYYDTSFETDNPAHLGTTYFLLKINGCLEYLYGTCTLFFMYILQFLIYSLNYIL